VLALDELSAAAADTLARAIVHALLAAEPAGGLPSYRSAYPSAFRD
jgi:L-aminopeptidase/D-esterase-like protein